MPTLRALILCLVVSLMLPWGAYSAARGDVYPGASVQIATTGASPQRAFAPRRCRGPALPGTHCGQFLPPETLAPAMPAQAQRAVPLPGSAPLRSGRSTRPPLGPPRSS